MNEKDTQFAGFAKALFEEIYQKLDEYDCPDGCAMCNYSQEKLLSILGPVIARRAYDLVEYVFNCTDNDDCFGMSFHGMIELDKIPDLSELPKTSE